MLYFDERGVSRHHDVSIHDNVLQWWRDAPGFSQRSTLTRHVLSRAQDRQLDQVIGYVF
jgi:hypothetical protein